MRFDQAAYQKARRAEAKASGVCVVCLKLPALENRVLCQPCRDRQAENGRQHYLRKKAERRARMAERRVDREQAETYEPLDALLSRPRTRILRHLRWFDWVTAESLWIALDVPDYDDNRNRERINYGSTLRHLVKGGLVEKRADHWPHEYRITPAGRAAAHRPVHEYERRIGVSE